MVFLQLPYNGADQRSRGYHAGLNCVWSDIRKYAVQLHLQKCRGYIHDSRDAGRVLGSQSRDGGHGIHTIRHHGLDISLNTGASAGITPGDC